MEYKMKKSMALGVVIMLCAVAMVGAGYAAFNGNARTYNMDNSATAGYATFASADWNAITSGNGTADLDTYVYEASSSSKTAYYFTGTTTTATINSNSYTLSLIGTKDFTLTNETGAAISAYKVGVTASSAVGSSSFQYFVKIGNEYKAIATSGTPAELVFDITPASAIADAGTDTVTIGLYIGYIANVYLPDTFIGPAESQSKTGYTQAAIETTTAPADFNGLSFALAAKIPGA
ncbi:adhesin-like protein [methanogenic archaeon ISO4-H5]|nr:adhesin-like protein [methanogenic archaeon ISO4-H5]